MFRGAAILALVWSVVMATYFVVKHYTTKEGAEEMEEVGDGTGRAGSTALKDIFASTEVEKSSPREAKKSKNCLESAGTDNVCVSNICDPDDELYTWQ